MTEPAVGASTWASGSQVCTGHMGIFTAKELKNASRRYDGQSSEFDTVLHVTSNLSHVRRVANGKP